MSKLKILVTTMHQTDFSKYHEMNLQTDAVIANQADRNEMLCQKINENSIQLVTTNTRGLSKNRNIAIQNIGNDSEFIMFADDDLRFVEGYEKLVLNEFEQHPEADAIKFNLNVVSERKLSMKMIRHYHRAGRREVGGWGVVLLAIRVNVLRKHNFLFNERFGTGTHNYCGEDTIFLQELFKKIRLYASPVCVADIDQSVSSWFEGYTERYFVTNGMILHEIYPVLCYLLVIRSAYRFSKRDGCGNLRFIDILRYYYKGIAKNKEERTEKKQ